MHHLLIMLKAVEGKLHDVFVIVYHQHTLKEEGYVSSIDT